MNPSDKSKTSSNSASVASSNLSDHQSNFGELGRNLFRAYRFFVSGAVFIFVSAMMAGADCLSNMLSKATVNSVHYSAGASLTSNVSVTGCTVAGMADPMILLISGIFSAVIFFLIRYLG